jgi:hypothetical protein
LINKEEEGVLRHWARTLSDRQLAGYLRRVAQDDRLLSTLMRQMITHEAARRVDPDPPVAQTSRITWWKVG